MHGFLFGSHGRGKVLARFSMLGVLAVVLMSGAEAAYAGPAGGPGYGGGYIGNGNGPAGSSGGYIGQIREVVSVRQALAMRDGTHVVIRGNITKSLGGNKYTFADSSGTVEVHIGPKEWAGQQVSASDTVLLQGEVKKEKTRTIIDVKQVVKQQDLNTGPGRGPAGDNIGHAREVTSAKQALAMKDGTHVTMRVNITKSLGGDRYIAADPSGAIEVHIGPKAWTGQRVTSGAVLLQGEVKKEKTRTIIDVKQAVKPN